MKRIFINIGWLFLIASMAFSDTMPTLIQKNQRSSLPEFPAVEAGRFGALQEAAAGGDASASQELYSLVSEHMHAVYRPLEKRGGLLFSGRRPFKGFESPENNYAVNLEHFFEETTDDVRIQKQSFNVHALDGSEYTVFYPEYNPVNKAVKVKDGEKSRWIPLAELAEKDQLFMENALMDDLFKSRDFETSIEDERHSGDEKAAYYKRSESEAVNRAIVLKNEGDLTLKNILVEYQVFAEQIVMGLPDDFPEDYRCVGFFEVASLAPNAVRRLPLELPQVVDEQLQSSDSGIRYYYKSGFNDYSKGRINGIRVRVHRITPYGQRLMVEHKSSGTPSVKWTTVAPAGADIR